MIGFKYIVALWFSAICGLGQAWIAPSSSHRVIISSVSQSRLWMVGQQEKTEDEWMAISKDMRLKEMQQDLKDIGISYKDCFDRESLVRKWIQSKQQQQQQQLQQDENGNADISETSVDKNTEEEEKVEVSMEENTEDETKTDLHSGGDNASDISEEEKEKILSDLRSKRVKELRTACAEANIRWANMIEKEDLVQALWNHKKAAMNFSVSGKLVPGEVADINDEVLEQETSSPSNTIMVLDVYATWCGPCQLMAPQLQQAAKEWGSNVRVAKMDSDKYPNSAGKLRVGGLPTVIIFDGSTGKELKRIEGALMKDGLMEFVKPYM